MNNKDGKSPKHQGFYQRIADDNQRNRLQMSAVSIMFGLIAAIMCIVNLLKDETNLTLATMIFSLVCFINVAILSMDFKKMYICKYIFSANLLMISTYLLVFDKAESGLLWLLLLPACGPILLGSRFGSVLSSIVLFEILYMMWTYSGQKLLAGDFGIDFRSRYPLIYCCFFFVGFWIEFLRSNSYEALMNLQIKFKEMSIRDALTGIYNRHWINTEMPAAIKRCKGKISLGVLILDLDLFKNINDTYGHIFGDTVLKEVADTLQRVVGDKGNVCRWGGEEFAVLVEGADKKAILELAEQIRNEVAALELEEDGETIHITVSVGATAMVPAADMRPSFLIDCADNALYEAKESGRNTVKYHKATWRYRGVDG
ncbi:MAG: GGDEF domain-containing protein [Clostridia bacterium]|nr:GGDEF domain-containing protein [Clostridia bacterium]